jgi:hypothetical protein
VVCAALGLGSLQDDHSGWPRCLGSHRYKLVGCWRILWHTGVPWWQQERVGLLEKRILDHLIPDAILNIFIEQLCESCGQRKSSRNRLCPRSLLRESRLSYVLPGLTRRTLRKFSVDSAAPPIISCICRIASDISWSRGMVEGEDGTGCFNGCACAKWVMTRFPNLRLY